jgi:putative peptidoglycan lipid II flippase
MAEDFRRGLRLIVTINVPAAVGLALLSRPIVGLLYERGNFNATDARSLANLLVLFSVGMPFFSIVNLTVRAFYAVKDIATPVRVAAIDFCINLVVSLSLMRWLGVPGLVIASTTAIIAQTLLLQRALVRRLPEMRFAPLWPSVGKVLAGTAAMVCVVAAGWWGLRALAFGARATDALAVFGLIPLGVAAYGLAIWRLRIEGWEELAALLARAPLLGRFFRMGL